MIFKHLVPIAGAELGRPRPRIGADLDGTSTGRMILAMDLSRLARWAVAPVLALLALLSLTAAGSPLELLPTDGRPALFGPQAVLLLSPATGSRATTFGRRPPTDRDGSFEWHIYWTGNAYTVFSEPTASATEPDGSIVFWPLSGSQTLYLLQFTSASDSGDARHEYALLWRLSAREYIGYLPFGSDECVAVGTDALTAMGFSTADAEACTVRSLSQLEALMRAYAATRPDALGTMRWLHRKPATIMPKH